jgi:4-hydroxy-tetrahydrodipicolinate reductase
MSKTTRIIISGSGGRMGKAIAALSGKRPGMRVVAGFDIEPVKTGDFPVYADPLEFTGEADVLIDFSSPAALRGLLSYCTRHKLPCVLCTTGYSESQLEEINNASKAIPVFRSGNMSLGISLMTVLVKKAAAVLGGDFDIEIVERHHRMKLDAPSGTAYMLAEAANSALAYEAEYVYDRHGQRQSRGGAEIGISAVRGGTIVGEHEVIFAGPDEVLELRHSAYSREVFATGAVTAAEFMASIREPGLYDMGDALSEILGQ